jgi:serine/threonine-protein kinase
MDSIEGKVLGRYEIIKKIGKGGMGTVYEAYQRNLNRRVAIKVLSPEFISDPQRLARFKMEAEIVARLNHPRIVQIYDISEEKGFYYFVMEFLKGRPLSENIAFGYRFSQQEVLDIASQVLDALRFAHNDGIIHRDIKPANIIVDQSGNVKVTDFGIAKLTQLRDVTLTGTLMGTPEYMSPEQVQGLPLDGRTDIYSLGIVMYEMLAGRPPFTGASPFEIIQQHINRTPVSLTDIRKDLPKRLVLLISRAIEKDINKRYDSAKSFLDEIELLKSKGKLSRRTRIIALSKKFSLLNIVKTAFLSGFGFIRALGIFVNRAMRSILANTIFVFGLLKDVLKDAIVICILVIILIQFLFVFLNSRSDIRAVRVGNRLIYYLKDKKFVTLPSFLEELTLNKITKRLGLR